MSMEKETRELLDIYTDGEGDLINRFNAYLTKLVAEAKAEAYEDAARMAWNGDENNPHWASLSNLQKYIMKRAAALRRHK